MFGHQDHKQDDDTNDNFSAPEPQHDAVLGSDDAGSNEGVADQASAPDVPQEQHEQPSAQPGYIMTDAPGADDADEPAAATPGVSNDLLDIKQKALQQLSPLVGHLDQSPEEKFRTTMMMIQASDDQHLVKTAYEAAQQIGDEKARAQALLDIVNEINYFTQHDAN